MSCLVEQFENADNYIWICYFERLQLRMRQSQSTLLKY